MTNSTKTMKRTGAAAAARPNDLPPADLSENARIVLGKRYLKKDASGQPTEEPEDMFWRVASTIAAEDEQYGIKPAALRQLQRTFYGLMASREFMPNSPTLMNAGRPLGQLSACFVLPIEDALGRADAGGAGIYDTLKAMALVHQSGGGCGFSFGRLRPRNDLVKSTTGVASGPVSFLRLYDASTDVVKQGGTRRGANMGILPVDHPDILDFVDLKQDLSVATNFNISIGITDAFMAAVAAGTEYDLVNPRNNEVVGRLDARMVWDHAIMNAWRTGEPGIFFIDRANAANPVPALGRYEATNPCGEQPLLPYDSCNLGSINVGLCVLPEPAPAEPALATIGIHLNGNAPKRHTPDGTALPALDLIDWERLRRITHLGVHFLDNVIDASRFPLPEIAERAHQIRRIGLGLMGFADLLIRIGVPYNSEDGLMVARTVFAFIDEEGKRASEALANKRGTFPAWETSIWGPDQTCARDETGNRIRPMRRLRNANVTTVAPTGTVSIFAGATGGIEPLFAIAFMRDQAGSQMPDVNTDFLARAKAEGWHSDELMNRIAQTGHIHHPEVPDALRRVFVSAHNITPSWHVRMQAAFQEHCDSAISKTCNMPHEATPEDVRAAFQLAYDLGCKGVTVYRDGSRANQILSTGATRKEPSPADADLQARLDRAEAELRDANAELAQLREYGTRPNKRPRPRVMRGTTRKMQSPIGDLFVTINEDERNRAFELFAVLGKAGNIATADVEAIGRLISLSLRFGIPWEEIHNQLRGISSDKARGLGPNKILSVPDAIAQALAEREQEKEGIQQELMPALIQRSLAEEIDHIALEGAPEPQVLGACPECGSPLNFMEGCVKCSNTVTCGYSECG